MYKGNRPINNNADSATSATVSIRAEEKQDEERTMETIKRSLFPLVVIISVFFAFASQAGQYDKLLSFKDVEKASGIKGLKRVAKDEVDGAIGKLNFTTDKNWMVLLLNVFSGDRYKRYKSQPGYFKANVKGVGDAAFTGMTDGPERSLFIKKGNTCVLLTVFDNYDKMTGPYMTIDQLMHIGKLVVKRI